MSQARKILKIISLIQAIAFIIAVVFGIISICTSNTAGDVELFEMSVAGSTWAIVHGIALLLAAVLTGASLVTGIKGANRPSSLGSHGTFCGIGLVLSVVLIVCDVATGVFDTLIPTFLAVLFVAAIVWGSRVRKELDR